MELWGSFGMFMQPDASKLTHSLTQTIVKKSGSIPFAWMKGNEDGGQDDWRFSGETSRRYKVLVESNDVAAAMLQLTDAQGNVFQGAGASGEETVAGAPVKERPVKQEALAAVVTAPSVSGCASIAYPEQSPRRERPNRDDGDDDIDMDLAARAYDLMADGDLIAKVCRYP